ncbi:hypothetical protein GJ744_005603 [Endocarpon pusillum]|uniref:DUF4476 domain-containing protein n=1 Tax=Endocarpon pusillum TaxID=364733 RepID=A0A8H7DYM9_9EURO|nr:hypothetical protein GJ744_005603 [Endocarpon pusillum]
MHLSPTTMLSGLLTLSLFLLTSTVRSAPITANRLINGLYYVSIQYSDFAAFADRVPNEPDSPEAQFVVDKYREYIKSQDTSQIVAPQSQVPYSEAAQYAVLATTHFIVLEDRRFVTALHAKVDSFTREQKKQIYQDLVAQYPLQKTLFDFTKAYSPDVNDIIVADFGRLNEVLNETVKAFETRKGGGDGG